MGYLFFLLLSLISIFSYNTGMTDTHILPKWLYTLGMFAIIVGAFGISLLVRSKRTALNMRALLAGVELLCLSQAMYAIVQYLGLITSKYPYRVVGSFDNPAGLAACLCVGIPCCFYFYRNSNNIIKWSSVAVGLLIGIALVLSESRAGIVAGVLMPCIWLMFCTVKKYWTKILLLILGGTVLVGMYFSKKDSADGRILMLHCGWKMVKERPLLGHGTDAIAAHYMDYQAAWLRQHPESRYVPLADNVKHVFNEYLSIVICYGFLGLGLLLVFVIFLFYCYRKAPSEEGRCSLMQLCCIGLLACFSYPFTYPFTWIILAMSAWILLSKVFSLNFMCNHFRYPFASILLMISIGLSFKVYDRIKAELRWGEVARAALMGSDPQVFDRYEKLMQTLGEEPYFLYNYAAELYLAGEYETALLIAQRCRSFWADYDLELLLGELLMKTGEYNEAETHYRKASNMCPVRFIPLHKLYELYQYIGDQDNAEDVRQIIIDKPIKINSSTIEKILKEVKEKNHL